MSLSFYSDLTGWLAWIALIRPIHIMVSLKGREAFHAGYFFGFFFNLFTIYWVALVSPPGVLGAIVILAFYYAFGIYLFVRLFQVRPWVGYTALPFIWTGIEYFRTLTEFGFPWSDLGYTQSYYLQILQIVSLVSVHGLTFIIVAVNVLLVQIFRRSVSPERKITAFFVTCGIILLLTSFGWITMPAVPPPGDYKVALLQGSVSIEDKWKSGNQEHSFELYDSLTATVTENNINLFIWPETSAPTYLTHSKVDQQRIGRIAQSSNSYHLVGALGAQLDERGERHYNSCYQFNPTGEIETRHDKVKLVPFAERVPYQDYLPFLRPDVLTKYLTFIKTYNIQWWSDFYAGDSLTMFHLPEASYAVMICFEITFPEYVRSSIKEGAEFIVGITNDTWFGRSVGVHMHSRMFVTRMVENNCWGIRVANSGLTYIVDGHGRIRDDLELFEVSLLVGSVKRLDQYTFFTQHGDIIGLLSFLITVLCSAIFLTIWIARKTFYKS